MFREHDELARRDISRSNPAMGQRHADAFPRQLDSKPGSIDLMASADVEALGWGEGVVPVAPGGIGAIAGAPGRVDQVFRQAGREAYLAPALPEKGGRAHGQHFIAAQLDLLHLCRRHAAIADPEIGICRDIRSFILDPQVDPEARIALDEFR